MLVSFWTPILLFISIAPAGNIGNCSCAILPSYPQRQGLCKSQLRLIPFSSPQPRSWGDIRRSETSERPFYMATTEGDDGVGSLNGPEYAGLFEARADYGFATGFDHA